MSIISQKFVGWSTGWPTMTEAGQASWDEALTFYPLEQQGMATSHCEVFAYRKKGCGVQNDLSHNVNEGTLCLT